MKIQEKVNYIQKFADKYDLIFDQEGECGFGRQCVGLLRGDKYIDYNPVDLLKYQEIPELSSDDHYEITPPNAYHKHSCIAVLGRGDDAVSELYDWVKALEERNVRFETFSTGATGLQAIMSGTHGTAAVID